MKLQFFEIFFNLNFSLKRLLKTKTNNEENLDLPIFYKQGTNSHIWIMYNNEIREHYVLLVGF